MVDAPPGCSDAELVELTRAELQAAFVCDRLIRGPTQRNEPALSPVAISALRRQPGTYTVAADCTGTVTFGASTMCRGSSAGWPGCTQCSSAATT